MKIAILISGRINNNLQQYQNFMNMFKNYDTDIFVSHSIMDNYNVKDNFIKLYNPKKIFQSNEKYVDVSKYEKNKWTNSHNACCMFLNRYNCLKLLNEYIEKTKTNYDIIISTRCDLLFGQPIFFEQFMNEINNEKICIPNINDHTGLNDQFAFGNYNVMQKYLNLYNELISLLDTGIIFHPETLYLKYIEKENIQLMRFNTNYIINKV